MDDETLTKCFLQFVTETPTRKGRKRQAGISFLSCTQMEYLSKIVYITPGGKLN